VRGFFICRARRPDEPVFLHQAIVFIKEHSLASKLERHKITEAKKWPKRSLPFLRWARSFGLLCQAAVYSETRRTQSLEGMNTERQEETRVLLVCAGEMA
jgi:hypothetical protein